MKENINLIQCGDHQYAPWCIICTHLINGESADWLAIDSNMPEVDYDWVCPKCLPTLKNPVLDDLKAVCIHCARKLREELDPNYDAEE